MQAALRALSTANPLLRATASDEAAAAVVPVAVANLLRESVEILVARGDAVAAKMSSAATKAAAKAVAAATPISSPPATPTPVKSSESPLQLTVLSEATHAPQAVGPRSWTLALPPSEETRALEAAAQKQGALVREVEMSVTNEREREAAAAVAAAAREAVALEAEREVAAAEVRELTQRAGEAAEEARRTQLTEILQSCFAAIVDVTDILVSRALASCFESHLSVLTDDAQRARHRKEMANDLGPMHAGTCATCCPLYE
jgi:hypothetical protein